MLPALLLQGLLKTKEVYQLPTSHYYGLESVVLTLAFMALARIKNPEQLKQCKPGEIGRIIGLDRIPEVKCLRDKIKLLSRQQQASRLNELLIHEWYDGEHHDDAAFLYIDGHVRVYYGSEANLPARYVSRQKLCLSATCEYWVNDVKGLPVMMVVGELNEKLQWAIEHRIIPQLQQSLLPSAAALHEAHSAPVEAPKAEVCTLVFDREAYEPAFFDRLWKQHSIAVLTYRKNVRDTWASQSFENTAVTVLGQNVNMHLCERPVELSGVSFREIRRLSEDGHQSSLITNNAHISMAIAAGHMFGRWSQENFFKYMIADYDFDKMIEFGTEAIEPAKEVVNPQWRKVNYQIKKQREKIQRLKAQLYPLVEQGMEKSLDEMPELTQRQMQIKEQIDQLQLQEQKLVKERRGIAARIALKDMDEANRYNRLKQESKVMMNIIKMICYRSETAVANLLAPFLKDAAEEKRMLVKQIIAAHADMIPDYEKKTLTVHLHTLSTPRYNYAVAQLAELLNQTQTIFPGSDLQIIFKTTAVSDCVR